MTNWRDSTRDTGQIEWKTPDGTPYTLSGEGIHNGEAYVANLPGRRVSPRTRCPSGTHVWWSGSGNAFGCPPVGGPQPRPG